MNKLKLDVLGITYSQTQNNAYALILKEVEGNRRLPIIIGGFEAQAIAIQIEKIKYSRPLTHDLFKNFADEFNIIITEVNIYKLIEGIFYSNIVCKSNDKTITIDARTSDAISIALKFNCPIYTIENIMKDASIDEIISKKHFDENDIKTETNSEKLNDYTTEELNNMLNIAIENEDYEQASLIRDEINKRVQK